MYLQKQGYFPLEFCSKKTLDLENFATASRRYTGDIHNSSVVGLFLTDLRQ